MQVKRAAPGLDLDIEHVCERMKDTQRIKNPNTTIQHAFSPLEQKENMHAGYRRHFKIAGYSLLLLQEDDTPRLIENRCGHFGVPLDTGELKNGTIVCSQHGISFDLETGEIANRPYEDADPIRVFDIIYQDGCLGVMLET